ncbi:MAG: hypothetical protein R3B60_04125 [Candidatus Paceibacterota bacterium]
MWSEVSKVEDINEKAIKLTMKEIDYIPSLLQIPPLIIIFQSSEDKTLFWETYKSFQFQ